MTHDDQSGLDWRGAIPVSRRFDDPYFSLAGGLAETRHVFLAGNGLPRRLRPPLLRRRCRCRRTRRPSWPRRARR